MAMDLLTAPVRHGGGGVGHALDSLSRREMVLMVGIVLGIFALLLLIGLMTQ